MPLHPEAVSAFRFIAPCSQITARAVHAGDCWMHEVKFDGYRVQAHKAGSRVVLFSRYAEYTIMRTPRQELQPAAAFSWVSLRIICLASRRP